jgi:hypothetical protein
MESGPLTKLSRSAQRSVARGAMASSGVEHLLPRVPESLLAAALALAPAVALGCGACIEDKIAATYDHALVTAAAAQGNQVVFGAIDGAVNAQRVAERIRAVAPKIRGVEKSTVRASGAPAAFSFVIDGRVTAKSAVAKLERRLGEPGLHLTVIRVQ